ncbi:MAG: type II secretory pathway component PulF [Verrucomicrobiales bacterium]|jgi:type II secretory pathway component PulF
MRLKLKDKIWLYGQLATFTKAGFGIDQSLRSLQSGEPNPDRTTFLEHVRERIRLGATLSEAIGNSQAGITPLEISIMQAAEMAGMLEQGFAHLAEYFESAVKTRRQVVGKLIYPALLIHLAILLPAIPRFVQTQDLAGTLVGVVIGLASVYAITICLVLAFRALWSRGGEQIGVDRLLRRTPLVGGVRKALSLQRFCSVLRMHVECGQKISAGAAAGGEASDSAVVKSASNHLAETARGGSPMGSVILGLVEAFPHELGSAIHNAEQTGMLSEELTRWTEIFRQRVAAAFERIGTWLPRLIYFAVVIFVIWTIFSMLSSIYKPLLDGIDQF